MKPTNDNRLINRLIANKLIQDLSSYLFYFHLIFQFYPPCYLVFYQYQWLSRSVWLFASFSVLFFVGTDSFVSFSVQFFVSYGIASFVSVNDFVSYSVQFFVSYSIWYQTFLFTSKHSIEFIGNAESLLDYLVGSSLSKHFQLYKTSQISYYTI